MSTTTEGLLPGLLPNYGNTQSVQAFTAPTATLNTIFWHEALLSKIKTP